MRLLLIGLLLAFAGPASALTLERIVIVERHGVRPPTSSNAELAKYSDKPWPAWPVAPGELTPHGAKTVALMGATIRAASVRQGLIPATGCPKAGEVVVWADGTDQRTRRSGEVLAEALAPGCGVKAGWAAPKPRDPIFGPALDAACRLTEVEGTAANAAARAVGPGGLDTSEIRAALSRLQQDLAPKGCVGGAGACFSGPDTIVQTPTGPKGEGPMFIASSLAENLLLEYAEGMRGADLGWGRVHTAADVAAVMAPHERVFGLLRDNRQFSARYGAAMARVILAALAGEPGPHSGPAVRVLGLAGHDTNIAVMGGVFGLSWTLPGQPDGTSPAQALVFHLWRDARGREFVSVVMAYETLDQLRTLSPPAARLVPLRLDGCASGPMGSCPLAELSRKVLALLPPGCGEAGLPAAKAR